MLTRRPGSFVLWAIALIVLHLCRPSHAQTPETLEKFTREPHIGKSEEALVGVEVTHSAEGIATVTRRGNGYVLRCDGFVLIPTVLLRAPRSPQRNSPYRSRIIITLHPGTEQEKRVATALPRVESSRINYAVVKLSEVHTAAVKTLRPDTLQPGDGLEIVWRNWNETAQRFGPVQKHKVSLKSAPDLSDNGASELALETVPPGVLTGAAIIGPEEMVVGMVTSAGQSYKFTSLVALNSVTNCITAQSVPDAIFEQRKAALAERLPSVETAASPDVEVSREEKAEAAPPRAPGMVFVSGGPVRLSPTLVASQRDMGNASTACVAPFLIDKYEVTNQQYLAFWESLPESKRRNVRIREALFPLSWADNPPYFPRDLEEKPVLGVTYQGANEYARWAGKRLPTPYEWSLAAFGTTGGNALPEWAKRYIAHRQQTWKQVEEAHFRYMELNQVLLAQYRLSVGGYNYASENGIVTRSPVAVGIPVPESMYRPVHIPWYFYRPANSADASWSKATVMKAITPLMEEWKAPQTVLSVGARNFDVSPYGARDMILNAFEMVCPPPEYRADAPAHYLRIRWNAPERNGLITTAPLLTWYEILLQTIPEGDIFLLSRRLRSSTTDNPGGGENFSPANQQPRTLAGSSIYEVAAMLYPISMGKLLFVSGNTRDMSLSSLLEDNPTHEPSQPRSEVTALGRPPNQKASAFNATPVQWFEAASLWYWKDPPRFFEREMGRPVDVDAPEGKNTNLEGRGAPRRGVADTYLLPGGFRCVR